MTELRQRLDASAGRLSDLADDLGAPRDMIRVAAVRPGALINAAMNLDYQLDHGVGRPAVLSALEG